VDRGLQATTRHQEPDMIFADSLPGFKCLLAAAVSLPAHFLGHVCSFVGAFVLHTGTMSCSQAANLFPQRRRHLATLTRFLADFGHSKDLLVCFRSATLLLEAELSRPGQFLFLLDGTKRHSQGLFLENSYSCGNSKRTARKDRKGKGQRKQYKLNRRRCHSFICGLLLTPGGLRLPYCRPYYTEEHCRNIDRPFFTDAELAAQMVLALHDDLPQDARVVVVGDTAYDAAVIRGACFERNYHWIVPVNPERVLAVQPSTFKLTAEVLKALAKAKVPQEVLAKLAVLGEKVRRREEFSQAAREALGEETWERFSKPLLIHVREKRRKVRAIQEELSAKMFEPVRLSLDEGPYRLQRRVSASRGGPGNNPKRTYWVHRRTEDVQSVGTVVLLFSKKKSVSPKAGTQGAGKADKILMSNAFGARVEELVAWYDLRWQIELMFKECKGVLGLDEYRVGKFVQVEGWVELCLSAFCYLEWYRARQLLRTDLGKEERQRWQRARSHDLCQMVRRHLEQEEVEIMCEMMETAEGRRQLAIALRTAVSDVNPSSAAA
jgi:hypothetical protein